MANSLVSHVSDSSFDEEVKNSSVPVLVDFWAEWCGPCKMIAPVLDEIAEEHKDSFKICKVDVDANQGLSQQFGVRAIPTLLFFKDGELKDQVVGMANKKDLISKLQALA